MENRQRPHVLETWRPTLRRVSYFRIYDLHSTYATRLSAGGCRRRVTQLLRQGDAQVFKKYSQMKREALQQLNRHANEGGRPGFVTEKVN